MHTVRNIFCLEGDWNENLKHRSSILPALELLELNNDIQTIYKTCASYEEFKTRIEQILSDDRKYKYFEIIYLAFHGSKSNLYMGKERVSLKKIAESFENKLQGKIIHIGSCKTLSDEREAYCFLNKTGAKAIAGYSKNVDFISSTVTDILFFDLCQNYERMHTIKTNMAKKYGDLGQALGFEIYY